VATGFEIQIERSAASAITGLFEGHNFGVLDAFVGVEALTYDLPVWTYDYCSYARIRRGECDPLSREYQSSTHEALTIVFGHLCEHRIDKRLRIEGQ
jgi:hypothetical protein